MKILGIIAGVIIALVLLLVALAPTLAESYAFKDFPPAERTRIKVQYKKWRTEPINLPASALDAKPYSDEIKNAVRTFDEAWEKYKDKAEAAIEAAEPGHGQKQQAVGADRLAALAPLIVSFTAVVRHPEYEIEVFASSSVHKDGDIPVTNFLALQTNAKLLQIKARSEMRAGKIDIAFRDAETIVAAAKSGTYDPLADQLIGIAICAIGVKPWHEIIQQCNDPATLRRTLQVQNELASNLHFFCDASEDVNIIDNVGTLRKMKRQGLAVEFQDLTGQQLASKSREVQADYLEQKVLPLVTGDPQALQLVQSQIKGYKSMSSTAGRFGTRLILPTFYALAKTSNEESCSRAKTALSQFDILRLATARKLYTLEKGKAPANNEALVPGYLPELPTDRHAKEKTPYRMAGEIYYSIGPDGKDDKNQFTYDPTNGAISAGDVALAR